MTHYLYSLFNAKGQLIYIGESKDAESRIKNHKKNQPWAEEIADFTFVTVASAKEAKRIEKDQIKEHKPLYNLTHNPNYLKAKALISAFLGAPTVSEKETYLLPTQGFPKRHWIRQKPIDPRPLPLEFDQLNKTWFEYSKNPDKIGRRLNLALTQLKENSLLDTPLCEMCGEESTWLVDSWTIEFRCQTHTWLHDYVFGDPADISLHPRIRCNPYNYVTSGPMTGYLKYRVLYPEVREATSLHWRKQAA